MHIGRIPGWTITLRWIDGNGEECAFHSDDHDIIHKRVMELFLQLLTGKISKLRVEH